VVTRLLVAGALAAAGAALIAVPEIWGIATWKWLLGIVGAWLFVTAGVRRKQP
jgi:hypothetical protein